MVYSSKAAILTIDSSDHEKLVPLAHRDAIEEVVKPEQTEWRTEKKRKFKVAARCGVVA